MEYFAGLDVSMEETHLCATTAISSSMRRISPRPALPPPVILGPKSSTLDRMMSSPSRMFMDM